MNREEILNLLSEEDIMTRYFGSWQFGKTYTNPWRSDKHPRCYFVRRNGSLYLVDFGNDIKNINCFQACMYYYGCSYVDCLRHIDIDFKLCIDPGCFFGNNNVQIRTPRQPIDVKKIEKQEIAKKEYTFEFQEFTSYDIKYWKRFKYDKPTIDFLKIKSVKRVYENGMLWSISTPNNPIFAYCDLQGVFKIYQPYGGAYKKWRTIRSILEGYELLPQSGDLLFITSSYKDVGVLKLLNYTSIDPPSETSYKLLYEKIPELKKRFKHIYFFSNNDEVGKRMSLKVTEECGLYYINIPNNEPKDPSDFVEKYDLSELDLIIKNKLKRDNIIT